MVSPEHEAIAQLFHANPGFVVELLRDHFGVKVPDFKEARTGSENFTEWNPTEYRADVVIVLATPDPVMAVIVEVQRSTDKDKRRTWPLYLTTLRARLRCPAVLLVVCPDAGVATWCAKSIPIGHPGWDLKPLVLGPDLIPVITDPAEAGHHPELTVLSAIAHGDKPDGKAVLEALLEALRPLADGAGQRYYDVTLVALSVAARRHLEDLVRSGRYQYQSDFARGYFSQGKVEGEAESIVKFLVARRVPLPDEARERILACADVDQLDLWLTRATKVTSADELFETQPAR